MPFQRKYGEAEAVAVALGEFALSIGLQQQWQMSEARHRVLPAEGAIQEHMQGRRRQPLLATDDMGHLHEVVIYDVGKVVGGELVGALPQHLVVEDGAVDADVAADDVIDVYVLAGLDEESYHVGASFGDEAVCLLLAERQ